MRLLKILPALWLTCACALAQSPIDKLPAEARQAPTLEKNLRVLQSPERLGPRQDRAQIEALIKETHLDDQLKACGLWEAWVGGMRGRTK